MIKFVNIVLRYIHADPLFTAISPITLTGILLFFLPIHD